MNNKEDGQKNRSRATQNALMRATEKLVAERGIENVTKREIVKVAGQKNESVLQYHFQNLQGLIDAIQHSRDEQTKEKRAELLEKLLTGTSSPTLRDLCKLMVMPTFLIAKGDTEFRRYISAFSLEPARATKSALSLVTKKGAGGESGKETGKLLRNELSHLDEEAYLRRMDSAVRLASVSIHHHARQKNAFRGTEAELFINDLIDGIVGLLSAPVSKDTTDSIRLLASKKK